MQSSQNPSRPVQGRTVSRGKISVEQPATLSILAHFLAMGLQIHAALDYELSHPTNLLLQFEAAQLPEQAVLQSSLSLSDHQNSARVTAHDCFEERIFLGADNRLPLCRTFWCNASLNRSACANPL
jgi:hypothetical protein